MATGKKKYFYALNAHAGSGNGEQQWIYSAHELRLNYCKYCNMISLGILENSNYNNNNNNKIINVHNNFTKYSKNPQVGSIASREDMESQMNLNHLY